MTIEEFNAELAKRARIAPEETQKRMKSIISVLTDYLIEDGKLTIQEFGSFSILTKKERMVSMPEIKKERLMPSKPMVIFRPGDRLKETIQKLKLE